MRSPRKHAAGIGLRGTSAARLSVIGRQRRVRLVVVVDALAKMLCVIGLIADGANSLIAARLRLAALADGIP